jgi:hypothetical protein
MAANYAFVRAAAGSLWNQVLLWLHGRRLGIFGDGQTSQNSSLVLDGVAIGSSRTGANPIKAVATGLVSAGAVTVPGVLVGDLVELVINLSTDTDVTANFETTVSVSGQVQQVSGSIAVALLFFINPQAAVLTPAQTTT